MKCPPAPSTPRAFSRAALAAGFALLSAIPGRGLSAPQQSILPRDQAARPFAEGRELVEKGRFQEAVPKLREALATGHEKPQERFGTSRHQVDYYDPHYWLGVALMELGDEAGALQQLRASSTAAGGDLFPDRRETQDRAQRIAELERREAARREARRAPTPTPAPQPTPAPAFATPVPTPVAAAEPARTPPVPFPTPVRTALPATPAPAPVRLERALAALAAGDFVAAATEAAEERRRSPGARELDLLEAAALGGRWVLEGRKNPALLESARERLAAFRRKGGSARAEATLLSPSLRALLEPR